MLYHMYVIVLTRHAFTNLIPDGDLSC
jgi:hypothetical protein